MYNPIIWLVMAILLGSQTLVFAADEAAHKYVGVKKCAMCHKSEAKGNQHGQWLSTKHAKAYERLASPEAKEAAKKAGVSGNPQESAKCLKCHITGYGQETLLTESFVKTDGVQCESCHGAGSDYSPLSVMKDKEKALKAGLTIPTKETCIKCHNQESPTYEEFKFEEYYPEIAHPRPKQ